MNMNTDSTLPRQLQLLLLLLLQGITSHRVNRPHQDAAIVHHHPHLRTAQLPPARSTSLSTVPLSAFSSAAAAVPIPTLPSPPPTALEFNPRMMLQLPLEKVENMDEYRCAGFDLRNTSLNVVGWSARPTEPSKVHHMTMYFCPNLGEKEAALILQDGGKTWRCEDSATICGPQAEKTMEFGPGFENMAGEMKTPADMYFPDSAVLPMGMKTNRQFAVIQVHNNAPIDADQSGFQLMLSPNPSPNRNQFFQMEWDLTNDETNGIPPLNPHYQIVKKWTVPTENGKSGPFTIFGAHLHFHSIGKIMTLEYARKKDEEVFESGDGGGDGGDTAEKELLKLEDGDDDWRVLAQRIGNHSKTIFLNQPLELSGGDRLRATVIWDSSKRTIDTPFGMDAFDNEMANVFVECYTTLKTPVGCIEGCDYLPK